MRQSTGESQNALSLRSGPLREVLLAALLVAVTLLIYIPAVRGGFFWDDVPLVADNPLIKAPDGLGRIWFTKQAAEYLPLTFTMHWVEWRLWGGRPEGFRLLNVALHAVAAVCLWRVLRRLRLPGAWLAGLIFAVHPVAVASAAWISELKNTLSMVFYLLSLLVYLKFDESAEDLEIGKLGNSEIGKLPNRPISQSPNLPVSQSPNLPVSPALRDLRVYFVSLFLFLLALLAKTSVVVLPLILLLCAWWRRGRISRKDLLRAVPFFVLSLVLGLVTVWFQWNKVIQGVDVRPEGLFSRVAAAGWLAWFYLCKLLLPVGLCAMYPRWSVDGTRVLAFLPLLLLLGCAAFLWTRRKSSGRAPLFALAYFLIALLPVFGFLNMSFMSVSLAADHLQYVAMIGVIAFAAGILAKAAGSIAWRGALAAGCVGVLAVLAFDRAALYGDEKLLWRYNLAANPAAWQAWSNLGRAWSGAGNYDEAIRCFDQAIALRPDIAESYYNRGFAHAAANHSAEAIQDYGEAILRKQDFTAAYNNRCTVYAQLHRYDDALRDCDRVIELMPSDAQAWYNRAGVNVRAGRFADAIGDCNEAIARKPDYPEAYFNRAIAWYYTKDYDKALADVKKCRNLGGRPNPDFLKALTEAAGRSE